MKISRCLWVMPLFVSAVLLACGGSTARPPSSFDDATIPTPPADSSEPLPAITGRVSMVCPAPDSGACTADSQCPANIPCGCTVGYCLTQSRCETNDNCAAGQSCQLSVPFIFRAPDGGAIDFAPHGPDDVGGFSHNEPYGYFCTTPADTCAPAEGQQPSWACVFDGTSWQPGESE